MPIKEPRRGIALAGVGRCDSLAECPVCSVAVAARRAEELKGVVRRYERAGAGVVYMATMTAPHRLRDDVRKLREALTSSWRCVWNGKRGQLAKRRYDIQGTVRALEVTYGENGAHPHLHVLLFAGHELDKADLHEWLHTSWVRECVAHGLRAPSAHRGVAVTDARVDDYITKAGLADEVAKAYSKQPKNGNYTHWQALAAMTDLIDQRYNLGDDEVELYGRRWDAHCNGFRGARWLWWSHGLRQRWGANEVEQVGRDERILAAWGGLGWDGLTYPKIAELQIAAMNGFYDPDPVPQE